MACGMALAAARCAAPDSPTPAGKTGQTGSNSSSAGTRALADVVAPLGARNWTTISGTGNFPIGNGSSGDLAFNFSAAPHSMNYLYRPSPVSTIAGRFIVSMTVTGNAPAFSFATESFNTCPGQAEARVWFQAHNDWNGEFGRWWSHFITFPLAVGSGTLTVPIDPDQWSSVNSKFGSDPLAAAGWQSAIHGVTGIGLTFGGGCFFGHGVFLDSGSARFMLTRFEIAP